MFFFSDCATSSKVELYFVMLSKNRSELMAAAMAAPKMRFLWKPSGSLTPHSRAGLFGNLFSDSTGVVAVATNPEESSATVNIGVADFFVLERVKDRIITVSFLRTAFMEVDVL